MKPFIGLLPAACVAVCMTGPDYLAWAAGPDHPATPGTKYDASWYKMNDWPHENPSGFTMAANVAINIRATLDVNAPKSVACALKKGATYHPWNKKRIASDGLECISFAKMETYELKENYTAQLARYPGGKEATIKFKKGDQWSFIANVTDGDFLMKLRDTVYTGGQDMFEKSAKAGRAADGGLDEWMKLKCANGTSGWILYNEIEGASGFAIPNTGDYGSASDR